MSKAKQPSQLEQVSLAMLNYKEAAYQNEIILNRTLRYVTGKLLAIDCGDNENVSKQIQDLIKDLNKIEPVKDENVKQD